MKRKIDISIKLIIVVILLGRKRWHVFIIVGTNECLKENLHWSNIYNKKKKMPLKISKAQSITK